MDFSISSSLLNTYDTINTSADKMTDSLSKDYTTSTDEELMDACKQFESYFIEQVFKEMEKTIPQNEEESTYTTTLKDYYKDELLQSFASTATDQQSLGIAQMLYEQMKRNIEG
jgi:flagellar protein FlgJ